MTLCTSAHLIVFCLFTLPEQSLMNADNLFILVSHLPSGRHCSEHHIGFWFNFTEAKECVDYMVLILCILLRLALWISSLPVFENISCVPERSCILKFFYEIFHLCGWAPDNCVFEIYNCVLQIYILINSFCLLNLLITERDMLNFPLWL